MPRNDKIMVRMTKEEKRILMEFADKSHMTVASLVRHLIFKGINNAK